MNRHHLKNLTLNASLTGKGSARIWLEGVDYSNPAGYAEPWRDIRFNGGEWYTNCHIHDLHLGGASGSIRNTRFDRIGEDLIRGAYCLFNVEIRKIRPPAGKPWHADLVQTWFPRNSIAYHVKVHDDCGAEGMTGNGKGFDGRAMVDCHVDNVKACQPDCTSTISKQTGRFSAMEWTRSSSTMERRCST